MTASNGDIWLSHHQNGCRRIRFDGAQFTSMIFKVEKGNLPSNKVTSVIEDNLGIIWICTQAGIVKVTKQKSEVIMKGLSFVTAISHKNQCFFLTNQGDVYSYNSDFNTFSLIRKLPVNQNDFAFTGSFKQDNDWVILSSQGSFTFDLEQAQLKANTIIDIKNGQCQFDNRGNCWLYNGSGNIYYINPVTRKAKELRLVPQKLVKSIAYEYYHIIHDIRGVIWISTYGNGLYAYDPITEKLTHFTYQTKGTNKISSNYLSHVMEDQLGNIWVAAEHGGVSVLSILNEGVSRVFPESETLVDRSNVIRMITRMKNGEIWITNRNGALYQYDNVLNLIRKREFFPYSIFAAMEDMNKNIWIGSRGGGLYVNNDLYTKESGTNPIGNNNIFDIFNDIKGRVWVGTFGAGLALATPQGKKYSFKHFFQRNYGESRVRKLVDDRNGWIWMATNNGVYVFHPDSLIQNSDNYYLYNSNNKKLRSNEIHSVYCDCKGNIWIGAAGMGVYVCHPTGNYEDLSFKHYDTSDGLINNIVQAIIEDKDGKMWFSTEYGISRFNTQTKVFENFFFSANALGNYYSENCAAITSDGYLLFGTDHGFVVINPQKVMPQHTISKIVFTGLKIDGVSMDANDQNSPLSKALSYTDAIELKHNQNSLIIEFSTFDFSFVNKTRYTYKLENFDKDWSMLSTLNFAAYKKIPPGHYRLHVRACNTSGEWADNEGVLDIIISPPFWKTSWAIVLYILFSCLVLYVTFKLINNFGTLRNRIRLEKQLTEYKLVFFTNIAHEFRNPLTLIRGGVEKISQNNDLPETVMQSMNTIYNSTKRLLRLIDQLLMFRMMQHNKLRLAVAEIDVISFAEKTFQMFYDVAQSKSILCRFIPFAKSYLMFLDKSFLDKILYNLLSNALKYTPLDGSITLLISLDEEKKQLAIQVADTGIGIPEEKRKELFHRFAHINSAGNSFGIGLHLTHELVMTHHGDIKYEPNQEQGSIFTVILPIDKNVYQADDFADTSTTIIKEESGMKLDYKKVMPGIPLNSIKLLIIDDDEDFREYIRNIMSNYFITKTATDGKSGISLVQEFEPDIILCDVLMPNMTGYEVVKQLKKDKTTSHIPVILLTSLTEDEDKMKGFESGADDFITKPFGIKMLLTRIMNIIQQRMELKELFAKETMGPTKEFLLSNNKDKRFVDRMNSIIEHNMGDASFDMDTFATSMGYKRTMFYQKVKDITGITPNEYLRNARLKKAGELLLGDDRVSVSEVCFLVGFTEPSYFSKSFKAYYGIPPTQFHQRGDGTK